MPRLAHLFVSFALSIALLARTAHEVDAGTAVQLDLPGLVRESDLVFEGRVITARVLRDAQNRIVTEHTVSVQRTYLGEPFGTRTFTLPGGVLPDGSGLVIAGMPRIEVGEDALLFLTRPSSNGWRMPVGLAQGKFQLARDAHGVASLVRGQCDLTLVDANGVVAPASADSVLDYEAAVREIENAVTAKLAAKRGAR